ncbi:MAG: L-threonylcarbamoyladenylate synthase [Minisyncoccia bacterium]
MFKEKILEIVKKIPYGRFLTYKEVAKKAGNENAFRAVGNILKNSKNLPCYRVVRSDYTIGGYLGRKDLEWLKLALLLKEGNICVMPTDTIYGICCSIFNKKSIEKVYKLRKRDKNKPSIILISSLNDLKIFKIRLDKNEKNLLKKLWPSKISVVLPCPYKKFSYLHRGKKTLAFRIPKSKELIKILKISGPLIAPSANIEGEKPAETIKEAKKYFGNNVLYYNKGRIIGKPSTIISFKNGKIYILRKGADFGKLKKFIIIRQ